VRAFGQGVENRPSPCRLRRLLRWSVRCNASWAFHLWADSVQSKKQTGRVALARHTSSPTVAYAPGALMTLARRVIVMIGSAPILKLLK
jgi:hypothetical protein